MLLVSELATNAVVHTRAAFDLLVDTSGQAIEISVLDGSPLMPIARAVDPDEPSGRGLTMVQSLADQWGVDRHDQGKRTWFKLAPSPPPE
jgi:anti-sigma regulatory factor (Ser/Thr protein kinase)